MITNRSLTSYTFETTAIQERLNGLTYNRDDPVIMVNDEMAKPSKIRLPKYKSV